jgi:serine phosphatase RsbU (regulator of sigma subunit)/anti-sigma regulatory factor (Ser/Thr protein kinase)
MNKKPAFFKRLRKNRAAEPGTQPEPAAPPAPRGEVRPLNLAPNDPLMAYINASPGLIEVNKLNLDSPVLHSLRAEGVQLALPLVSQGELIGLLNLGPRMSEQEYSSDDYRLLNTLATQASPALRIAQLARQQLVEAQERERIDHELRVARVIQETLLPKEVPTIAGWELAACWKPAREVSGDFYDFLALPDGRIGVLVADVTDKGVPAAMVMATSRSILRAVSERLIEPGAVLARANDLLYPDIPQKMFVTCLYLVIDVNTGVIQYANAGHNLPYVRTRDGVVELRATGMPLGLLPGMPYEQKEFTIQPGQTVLLSSDGIVEAHSTEREMFGFPRMQQLMAEHPGGGKLIDFLMASLNRFVSEDYEQEDDITLVTIQRAPDAVRGGADIPSGARTLGKFVIPSAPGNERGAARQVLETVTALGLPEARLKRLETAVAESTMNAMEHGNQYDPGKPVDIKVMLRERQLLVHITDHGGGAGIPKSTEPNLEAKLAGEQSPRGWGLFIIKNMVDELNTLEGDGTHTIELVLNLDAS